MTKLGRPTAGVVSILGVVVAGSHRLRFGRRRPDRLQRAAREPGPHDARGLHRGDRHRAEFRDANDSELANQIVEEGEASPADVFLTENSPAIDVVDEAGLLAPLDDATLDQVDQAYRRRRAPGSASPPAPRS